MDETKQKEYQDEIINNLNFQIYYHTSEWYRNQQILTKVVETSAETVKTIKQQIADFEAALPPETDKTKVGRKKRAQILKDLEIKKFSLSSYAGVENKYLSEMNDISDKIEDYKAKRHFMDSFTFKDIPNKKDNEKSGDNKTTEAITQNPLDTIKPQKANA